MICVLLYIKINLVDVPENQDKIFFIEKIPRGKYVRYDGILKRLKVYLFGRLFDDIIACCVKNHKKILKSVKHIFSFIREEFSINVCKSFNRLFIREPMWEVIQILFYAKCKNVEIDKNNLKIMKEEKNNNIEEITGLRKFDEFLQLKTCNYCNYMLSKLYIDVVNDMKNDRDKITDYLYELKKQGYSNRYTGQFDEMVNNFEHYMGLKKKFKTCKQVKEFMSI